MDNETQIDNIRKDNLLLLDKFEKYLQDKRLAQTTSGTKKVFFVLTWLQ